LDVQHFLSSQILNGDFSQTVFMDFIFWILFHLGCTLCPPLHSHLQKCNSLVPPPLDHWASWGFIVCAIKYAIVIVFGCAVSYALAMPLAMILALPLDITLFFSLALPLAFSLALPLALN
jgi:hypothetical protein